MKALLILTLMAYTGSAIAQTKKYTIAANLQATINHTPGAKTVQVLIPGVETIELDLTQSGGNTFLIKTTDYNFDGFKDFAMTSKDASTPGAPTVYDIYLYHPADKTFEALEVPGGVCDVFGNVKLGAGDKTLRSSCKGTAHGSTDVYRYDTPFSLALVKSTDNSADATAEKDEEKTDKKAEKADQRQDRRDEIKDKKDARRDAKDEGDD